MKGFVLLAACVVASMAYHHAPKSLRVNPRYRPSYHLAPPFGWMNDPNGFSHFRGEYHLFYQYNPYSSQEPGVAHWAHAKSKDLFHWKNLPIALWPDELYDRDGVFSGSAVVVNDTLFLVYTGNVNHKGQTPDHEQHQHLAFGEDGINFEKYKSNPVIAGDDRQPDFRDPKVWKHGDTYYVVLGNSVNGTRGRALLYSSTDLVNWQGASVLAESDGSLGYNWECPDFFELDGKFVLLMSPQGMAPRGDKYHNLYQTGYIVGSFDYATLQFTPETEFEELDRGHDLYASQTLLDEDGRRIAIAWMDMLEQVYPERDDGWTGQMTTPRTLKLSEEGKLLQWPVREFEALRSRVLFSSSSPDEPIVLESGAAEVLVSSQLEAVDGKVGLQFEWGGNASLTVAYESGEVTLTRGGGADGARRAQWSPAAGLLRWRLLLDRSSVELFCGEGELVFTSRFFPTGPVSVRVMRDSDPFHLRVVSLARSVDV